ncbi:MAG: type II toxin-antitoxin system VapC family toxin [Hyphomicrobiaceae bacterium]|nr:type II toxin-antitoxin system VapC family toxin [Hyphomicrobiaceae bacterium]
MIVADASALLAVVLRIEGADAIEAKLFGSGLMLHAPHVLDAEVAHVICRYAATGQIGPQRGRELLADLSDLPLYRHAHDWLLPRVWQLRHSLTCHDGLYVALAEALDALLVPRDRRLAAAPGHHARVEVV